MKYRAHRHPTRFPITFEMDGVRQETTMASISASGARIATQDDVIVGKQVVVAYSGGKMRATVCWSSDGEVGVAFGRPLSAAEVEKFRYQTPGAMLGGVPHRRPQSVGFKMLG